MNGDKQRHGPNIRWHEGGEIKKYERSYSYNVLDGLYEEWYSNGKPKLRTVYDKGRINGVYKIWYSNGQIKIQASYNGDQRVGSYKEFYRNGNPKTEYMYAPNGDFEGLQTTYRKNGFKISELTYIGGKKVGQKFWLPNGQADPVLYR